jgi:hypothetical protein
MPRPRTPLAKAKVTGQDQHHVSRFRARVEPDVRKPLGNPPTWMTKGQKAAWKIFEHELFWLNDSHRALLEIASHLRASLMAGDEVNVQKLNLLRLCLSQMGATPADSSKVYMPETHDDADASDKYFN